MDSAEKNIWRFLPVGCFALCIAFIIFNIFIPFDSLLPGELHTYNYTILLNSVTALAFLYLIVKPKSLYVYSGICALNGLINIIEGGSIFGGALLCVGLSVAFRKGFFHTYLKTKVLFFLGILFAATLFQLRLGVNIFFHSALVIVALFMIEGFFLLILRNYFSALLPAKTIINLADYDLQERDYDLIRRVSIDEKYSYIANTYTLSESAIKHRMSTIYKKFDVKDRNEFITKCHNSKVMYPELDVGVVENPLGPEV